MDVAADSRMRTCLARLLVFLCTIHSGLSACYFPVEVQGQYVMQSTATSSVQYSQVDITADAIPIWGHCHRRIGNNVILKDESGGASCIRCFHVRLRSRNVLQVHTEGLDKCYTSEHVAEAKCPSEATLHVQEPSKEILLYKSQDNNGEPIRPEYCPINGRFTFTYSGVDGECPVPVSELDNCPSGASLGLRFRRCSFPDYNVTYECLGHWEGPGNQRYLSLLHASAADHQPRYRCALFREEPEGSVLLAFSSDSTCRSELHSAAAGHEMLRLAPARPAAWPAAARAAPCRFPTWAQGRWQQLTVEGSTVSYRDHVRLKTFMMHCLAEPTAVLPDRFPVFARTHCGEEMYNCIWIKLRGNNVLEFQLGTQTYTAANHNLCSDSNFRNQTWITQGRLDRKQEIPCPIAGKYTGIIPDGVGLCAKLSSDCNSPDIMYYTVSDCSQGEIYEGTRQRRRNNRAAQAVTYPINSATSVTALPEQQRPQNTFFNLEGNSPDDTITQSSTNTMNYNTKTLVSTIPSDKHYGNPTKAEELTTVLTSETNEEYDPWEFPKIHGLQKPYSTTTISVHTNNSTTFNNKRNYNRVREFRMSVQTSESTSPLTDGRSRSYYSPPYHNYQLNPQRSTHPIEFDYYSTQRGIGSSWDLRPTQDSIRMGSIQSSNPWYTPNRANPYAHVARREEVGSVVNCDLFPCAGNRAVFDSTTRNLGRQRSEADKRSEYAHHNAGNIWSTDNSHENWGHQFREHQTGQPRLSHNNNLFTHTGSQLHTIKDVRRYPYSSGVDHTYSEVPKPSQTTSASEDTDLHLSFSSNSHTVSLPAYSTERPVTIPTRNGQNVLSHNSRLLPTQLQSQGTSFPGTSDATAEANYNLKLDRESGTSHTSFYRPRIDRPIITNQPVYHLTGTVPMKRNENTGSGNRNGPGKMRQAGLEFQSGFRDHMEVLNYGYNDRSGYKFNPSNLTPRNSVRNGKPIIQEIPIENDRVYVGQNSGMVPFTSKSHTNHSFVHNFSGTTRRSFYGESRRLDAVQFLQAVSTPTVPLSIRSRRPHNSYRGAAAHRKEREYRCLGQWEEDGLMYTYTQRRDVEAYECFVGSIVSDNEIFIKEAGEHCQRNTDPLQHGMRLSKMGSCSPGEVTPPQNAHTTPSWLSIRPSTEMTKPWKPITAPPRVPGRETKSATSMTTPTKGLTVFLLLVFTLVHFCVL